MRPSGKSRVAAGTKELLLRVCQPVVESQGLELVDAEWNTNPRQPMVRVYLHRKGGVTIGECQKVHRLLEPLLTVEGILDDRAVLEVASPGLDRPLRTAADFRRAEGRLVTIRFRDDALGKPVAPLTGRVLETDEETVVVLPEKGESAPIPLAEILEGKFEIRF